MRFTAGFLVVAALSLPSVPAFGAVAVPLAGLVSADAIADGPGFQGSDNNFHADTWSAVPTTLFAGVASSDFDYYGTAIATTSATANWTSSDAGTIAFDHRALVSIPDGPIGNLDGYGTHIAVFDYKFIASVDGVFHFDYDIENSFTRSGSPTEESVYDTVQITLSGNSADYITLSGTGSLDFDLFAGQSYDVFMYADDELFTNASGILAGTQRYSFSITERTAVPPPDAPVPEPTTWSLMLSGFGLMGALIRRRQWMRTPGQPSISAEQETTSERLRAF